MGNIMYATREVVRDAVDTLGARRANAAIDRALLAATNKINGELKRDFAPWTGTKYFDWPNADASTFRIYLDTAAQLISLTALSSGGVSIDPAQVNLEPNAEGPPYDRIEVNRNTIGSFTSGLTFQRSLAVTGVWGYDLTEAPAGVLVGAIDSAAVSLVVSDPVTVGVGSLLRLGAERLVVTEKTSVSVGSLLGSLADEENDQLAPVADGTAYHVGEVITLDTERCQIDDILGNNLVLRRAVDGTTLSSHAGSVIYSARRCTVARGQRGTTAAAHSDGSAVMAQQYPELIQQYAIAEALIELQLQASSYARTRPATGGLNSRGVPVAESGPVDIRAEAVIAFGRAAGRALAI